MSSRRFASEWVRHLARSSSLTAEGSNGSSRSRDDRDPSTERFQSAQFTVAGPANQFTVLVLVLQERGKEEGAMQEPEPGIKPPKLPKLELGSNSLLIIALIVGFCSGSQHRGENETHQKIERLQQIVERLEKKVDKLAATPTSTAGVR